MAVHQLCPLCGADKSTAQYTFNSNFKIVKCKSCRFSFMSPYPSDEFLDEYYRSAGLYNFTGENRQAYERSLQDRIGLFGNLLQKIDPARRRGYAVDFGAGIGMAVAALAKHGFDAIGIEKNPRAAAAGKALFGVDIVDRELDDLPREIDLLTMFDVLEHIKYPKDFLRLATRKMSRNASLIGSVPNYNGMGRLLYGTESGALSFPQHVNQFTKRTLTKTLEESGFEVLYIGFPPPYGVTITLRLRAMLQRHCGNGSFVRFVSKRLAEIKKYLVYPLPNFFAEQTGLLGHSLVFVAQKRP